MTAALASGPRVGYDLARVGSGLSRGPNKRRKLTAAAWSGTWPAPGATLDLDFSNNRGFVRGLGQGGAMDAVTFTRASSGTYLDSAGVLQTAASGTYRLDWTSTATVAQRNLLAYTEQFDNSVWVKVKSGSVTKDSATAPDGSTSADTLTAVAVGSGCSQTVSLAAGQHTFSVWAKRKTGSGSFEISVSGGNWVSVALTASWTRFSVTQTISAGSNFPGVRLLTIGDEVDLWGAQLDLGSSATAYQTLAQPTTQTPLAAATTCNGLLIEESRANRILWCRDATQSGSWTCTNVTPLKDQTGIDGVANSASSLTATADGGTCIQTITLTSGSRTGSVYLKRITGTGNVQVSLDGSTWSTVDLSNGLWNRIVISGTVTNPTVGIKLAVNGDAVAMDYAQCEDGADATTPILTTTASATRSTDVATIPTLPWGRWYNNQVVAFIASGKQYSSVNRNACLVSAYGEGSANSLFQAYVNRAAGDILFGLYNTSGNQILNINPQAQKNTATGVGICYFGTAATAATSDGRVFNVTPIGNTSFLTYPTQISIGNDRGLVGIAHINGAVKRIAYVPKMLSSAALQAAVIEAAR